MRNSSQVDSKNSSSSSFVFNENDNETEEEFYESLDRIISSSCSTSASASASDDESSSNPLRSRRSRKPLKHFHSSMYDVWVSEPSSVEERRRVLLQKLDLIGDPSLSRPRSFDDCREMERSVSCNGYHSNSHSTETGPIFRSRSDNSVCSNNKPPLGKSRSSSTSNGMEDEDFGGGSGGEDKYCVIKNLDNGVEFVVKELREDGMWNKIREVGTGRQLTMEEFKNSVIGHSPIVEELMRRVQNQDSANGSVGHGNGGLDSRLKKKGSWLRSIKSMAGTVVGGGERRSSDERDTSSSEKGGRRSSSATDDSQDLGGPGASHHVSERVKVRQYGRSWKELTGLYMNQEICAHSGSIWSIKFSLDGRYLASAGEDCVIHVWKVLELERKRDIMAEKGLWEAENGNYFNPLVAVSNGSPEIDDTMSSSEKRRRAKVYGTRKSFSLDHVIMPENVFALSDKPVCSFAGHQKDVLDLSWSKSKLLLSSSMDKTVRLWDMSGNACLKTFSHSDYVTCIQFNPLDDKYFISGSLDAKVRLWSIERHQVVDWNDLHEMITAACYTPDGQGALVGSHKGSCNFYDTSDNKLQQKCEINLQNKKKKSHLKKITGFQFAPRSLSEVLITSADSRIRVVDDNELVHKLKGFRNTSSQISASLTADGKHVVCASEDSNVYVWKYDADSRSSRSKGVTTTHSYEYFHCSDVSVAVAWPGPSTEGMQPKSLNGLLPTSNFLKGTANGKLKSPVPSPKCNGSHHKPNLSAVNNNHFSDRISATWPEEKLFATANKQITPKNGELISQIHNRSAWGMVIVAAGRGGEIKIYQNFGYPVHV